MSAGTAQTAPLAAANDDAIMLREEHAGVVTLTLNRPKQYNLLSEEMLAALQGEIDRLAEDRTARVLVLAGVGKAFCAGHDLKQMRSKPDQAYYERLFGQCSRMMQSLLGLPQPVIARVQGIATAAGCQLVASCDLAVASTEARFATSGIGVGLFCMTPGVALSRNLARKQAFEMLFTGDFIDAETAREHGLVNRVVAPEALDETVAALAGRIVAKSGAAIAAGKQVFYKQLEMGLSEAYGYAAREMACNMMFADAGEGIDAFIEKRQPVWKHR